MNALSAAKLECAADLLDAHPDFGCCVGCPADGLFSGTPQGELRVGVSVDVETLASIMTRIG